MWHLFFKIKVKTQICMLGRLITTLVLDPFTEKRNRHESNNLCVEPSLCTSIYLHLYQY